MGQSSWTLINTHAVKIHLRSVKTIIIPKTEQTTKYLLLTQVQQDAGCDKQRKETSFGSGYSLQA